MLVTLWTSLEHNLDSNVLNAPVRFAFHHGCDGEGATCKFNVGVSGLDMGSNNNNRLIY